MGTRLLRALPVLVLAPLAPAQDAPLASRPTGSGPFELAARRAPVANEALRRARAVLDGWWALRDPESGLLPRRVDQQLWAPQDNAADLLPFLYLSARFTRPELVADLHAVYRREVELTTRAGWLPDWYSIAERRFLHAEPDAARIVFGATEYAKDGLNPLIELVGPDPWRLRMRQLVDGVLELAPVESDFGRLPAADTEVNGEMLQVLTRLHFLTGEERYIEWAERIADAYCLEVLPESGWLPAQRWDFAAHRAVSDRLYMNDHGNEIIGGLAEVYAAVSALGRESAARHEQPLRRMFDRLLEVARNEDGLWYGALEASTGKVLSDSVPDTWGYALAATASFGLCTGEQRYVEAARRALRGLDRERYLEWGDADAMADSIEGALLLLARFPEPEGFAWLERILPRFFARQALPEEGGSGIVEGVYWDGNYARTALMVALHCTQGASVQPWSEDISLGAAAEGERLFVLLASDAGWSGALRLDHPRHRDHFRLPRDLPRLNEFPEWYTVAGGELYGLTIESSTGASRELVRLGSELCAGLPLALAPGESLRVVVAPRGPAPFGAPRGPSDPWKALAAQGGDPALVAAVDLDGGESYAGESYRWTGRAPIEWRPRVEGAPPDATLWLRWGAKSDLRRARLVVGGRAFALAHGGYDGYDWLALDVPAAWWEDGALDVRLEPPPGAEPAAFLSALRLRRLRPRPAAASFEARVEAEDMEGGWDVQANVPGWSGAGFRVSNAGGLARDGLRVALVLEDGRHFFWVRGYEGDGLDRRFALAVGGERFEPTHRGRWGERFRWQLAGSRALPAGRHVVEVRDAGLEFEVVDALWVTSDPFFDPGACERIRAALLAPPGGLDPTGQAVARCVERAGRGHARVAAAQGSLPEWERERARLRERLAGMLGLSPPPARTPLAARTVGVLEREGYRVEKVVFESRPGFPVSANVYVPAGSAGGARRPAVLCPTGHWDLGKAEPVVQERCIGLVLQGYVALTYDPFGQGERDVDGNDHHEYFRSILVGRNNMSFMVWDTVRALDYLLERPDVDPERIACTGASGGGLNTLYAAAFDERIRVAVPAVYVTRLREFLETRHPHCPCSHVNGLAGEMDMGDVAALIAPRPLLLLTAARDASFTPAGARAAADQARGAYALYGAAGDIAVRELGGEHDYGRAMREALYGFLALHLSGEGDGGPRAEEELSPEPDGAVLDCFEGGRVPRDAQTVRSLCAARAQELVERAPLDPRALRTRARALVGGASGEAARPAPLDAGLLALQRAAEPGDGRQPLLFETPAGPWIGGWRLEGGARDGPRVVLLVGGADSGGSLHPLAQAAAPLAGELLVLDVLGAGGGGDLHVPATAAHLAGEPLLFRRARALAAVLRRVADGDQRTVCLADGLRPSLVLLLARAAGAPAHALGLAGLPASLIDVFEGDLPSPDALAWELLELGDVPDLIAAAGVPVARLDGEAGGSYPAERVADLLRR